MQERKKKWFGYHSSDTNSKARSKMFVEFLLPHLGIREDVQFVAFLDKESVTVDIKRYEADLYVKLSDNTGLNIEFQTQVTKRDLHRLCIYNHLFSLEHGLEEIQTIIITAQTPEVRELQNASCHFCPQIINLKERNAKDKFEEIREKIANLKSRSKQ